MSVLRRVAAASACLVFLFASVAANAGQPAPLRLSTVGSFSSGPIMDPDAPRQIQRLLSDHPGAATALTNRQKAEIRTFVTRAKGKDSMVCTGLSLTGQRQSMYRVVRLRAELVCDYAKSIDSSLTTTIRERTTRERNQNGRVVVSSS
jgi:hypothetical protein